MTSFLFWLVWREIGKKVKGFVLSVDFVRKEMAIVMIRNKM